MPVFPIPIFVAFALGFLLLQSLRRGRTNVFMTLLLAACATQSLIIPLVQHYGVAWLRPFQPVMAVFIPPVAWLAFVTGSQRPFNFSRDFIHLAVPVFATYCTIFTPASLDVLVPAIFAGYGGAILWIIARGADGLPRARLESGDLPLRLWSLIALSLVASALGDVLIVLAQILRRGDLQPLIVSVFSSLTLFVLGAISLSRDLTASDSDHDLELLPERFVDPSQDAAVMGQLNQYMAAHSPFLDPNLTLAKLARKINIPAKQLSAAINRNSGKNVSRYMNCHRIDYACQLLANGSNVTAAIYESGFNTKSNFNREFLRVKNMTPSEWLARLNDNGLRTR